MKIKISYSRKDLITLCEKAFVPYQKWHDRDSPHSQIQIGTALALLKDGLPFEVCKDKEGCSTDEQTVFVDIFYPDFCNMEEGEQTIKNKENWESKMFYIPTQKRLNEANRQDWY